MVIGDGANLLIGPLLAHSVHAVAPISRAAGVPVIAFSSDRTVAGSGIYTMGFLPENEVERVVTYALSRGLSRFAVLAPDDAYGATVVSALSAVTEFAMDNKVPVMTADPSSAEKFGVLAAWGFDSYKMGRATGRMISQICKGTKPANIPTLFMTDPSDVDLLVNVDIAKKLGLSFPPDVLKTANTVIENGKMMKK